MNARISPKDLNLIKGAFRRVFARSEMHKPIVEACRVPVEQVPAEVLASRPRVKAENWARCPICKSFTNKSSIQVDHLDPVIPVNRTLAEMEIPELIDRVWCDPANLQATCKECHAKKTEIENAERRAIKKARKAAASLTDTTHRVKVKRTKGKEAKT